MKSFTRKAAVAITGAVLTVGVTGTISPAEAARDSSWRGAVKVQKINKDSSWKDSSWKIRMKDSSWRKDSSW
jgi:hypothetical protein